MFKLTKTTMMMAAAALAALSAVQSANASGMLIGSGSAAARSVSATMTGAPGDWFVSLNTTSSHHAQPPIIGFGWGFGWGMQHHCEPEVTRVVRRPRIRRAVVVTNGRAARRLQRNSAFRRMVIR